MLTCNEIDCIKGGHDEEDCQRPAHEYPDAMTAVGEATVAKSRLFYQ